MSIFIVSLFFNFLILLFLCIGYLIVIPPLFGLMKLPSTLFISRRNYAQLEYFIFQTSLNHLRLSHSMLFMVWLNKEDTPLHITQKLFVRLRGIIVLMTKNFTAWYKLSSNDAIICWAKKLFYIHTIIHWFSLIHMLRFRIKGILKGYPRFTNFIF